MATAPSRSLRSSVSSILNAQQLEELVTDQLSEDFKKGVILKDRRLKFKTYPQSFVGSEAVTWLCESLRLDSRAEARKVGQKLMDNGLFSHVLDDQHFEDAKFLYKFNDPETADLKRRERQTIFHEGWLEKKGMLGSYKTYWFELKGNIVRYYPTHGTASPLKGKFNVANCTITNHPTSNQRFDIKLKNGSEQTFKAESEKERNQWVLSLCKARDCTLEEHSKLVELWSKEGECLACMAALATEQAEEESEESNGDENSISTSLSGMELGQNEIPNEIELLKELLSLPVYDVDEQEMPLREVFDDKYVVVLALLRHFGCLLCRQAASVLSTLKPELDQLNIGLVAVGNGTPLMAKSFQQDFNFPGKLYVDQKRAVFKELGCNRGLKYVMNSKAMKAIKNAISDGFGQGKTTGDTLQLGGVFVISKQSGLIYQHLEQFAGDHCDPNELMAVCRQVFQPSVSPIATTDNNINNNNNNNSV